MRTRKDDLVEVLHGVRVADPYRWLEDGGSPEVRAWDEAQTAETRAWLTRVPGQAALRARAKELLSVGHVGAPVSKATGQGTRRYFHVRREGAQEQAALYVRDGIDGADRVLIDPAPLSADGTTTIDWWAASHDGALVAWGLSEAGSEESTLRIRDVATGKDLADAIPHTRHATVAWLPDGSAFYYTRYPAPGDVPPGDEKYSCRVFLHTLGADWKGDARVFGDGRDKLDVPAVLLSPGGRWLVVRVHMGWQKSEVWLRDLESPGAGWVAVARGQEAIYEPVPLDDVLYLVSNEGAPRYRLFEVDYASPQRAAWREVLHEQDDVLTEVAVVGGAQRSIVASYLHEASARIERFARDGKPLGPVELPVLGSASVVGAWDAGEVFVEFTSFATPWRVLRCAVADGATTVWDRVGASSALPDVRVSMLYATSKDGTRVPMFVVEKAGTPRDGDRPAVLYGYGGFNIAQTPAFSARTLLTVEHGGVWVVALLRGGAEFGEEWHRAGMLERKQNVFDDLYACAEELFRAGVTRPERLGVVGGSNGGLLVAAAVTQRPDTFRAGLSLVPLADMLRYHRFRIGALWTAEYGDPDDAAAFGWLHAYSPYHQARGGVRYPSVLFATADSDSRVDPMHARKMAARLQESQSDPDRPILLRVESRAGHGAGKPVAKLVDELVDELAFLFHELGMK
ncbi:MAG TPA: prolyl oligopeptidase family serine peptidase [Polyangiaceae bacterium]